MRIPITFTILATAAFSSVCNLKADTSLPIDQWTYVQVDDQKAMWGDFDKPSWLRYFGLGMGDVNNDGLPDIVTGRNVYLNPGKDLLANWKKLDLGKNVDASLLLDSDGNGKLNLIAEALPDVWVFEYTGESFTSEVIGQIPPTGHHNGQGYRIADLILGESQEILLASQGGIYLLAKQDSGSWTSSLLGKDASDEGFAVADIDGDGDLDLVSGFRVEGKDPENPTVVVWFENDGQTDSPWIRHELRETAFAVDRVEAADLNGDGKTDVIVAEERYPGEEPDATLWVYLQTKDSWKRQKVVTQYSMNNLDVADMDADGDVDLITSEHKGPTLALQIWSNDGNANFAKTVVDTGKENHLGARVADMDNDGDLDIVGIGWDQHSFVHLWRNNAK